MWRAVPWEIRADLVTFKSINEKSRKMLSLDFRLSRSEASRRPLFRKESKMLYLHWVLKACRFFSTSKGFWRSIILSEIKPRVEECLYFQGLMEVHPCLTRNLWRQPREVWGLCCQINGTSGSMRSKCWESLRTFILTIRLSKFDAAWSWICIAPPYKIFRRSEDAWYCCWEMTLNLLNNWSVVWQVGRRTLQP